MNIQVTQAKMDQRLTTIVVWSMLERRKNVRLD